MGVPQDANLYGSVYFTIYSYLSLLSWTVLWVCMTSICDTRENLAALSRAIKELDGEAEMTESKPYPSFITSLPPAKIPLCEAVWLDLPDGGEISNSYLWVYPPGIPLLLPGEVITEEIKKHLEMLKNSGISPKIIKTS